MGLKISLGDKTDRCIFNGYHCSRRGHAIEYGHFTEEITFLTNGENPLMPIGAELYGFNLT